jgi:hypothetical protein
MQGQIAPSVMTSYVIAIITMILITGPYTIDVIMN